MYNECENIHNTAKILTEYLDLHFGDYEIIFSNDGSTDDSADIACNSAKTLKNKNIRVVGYPNNKGKGCAVRTAILAAKADIILFTDCDLAYGT